MRIVTGNVVIIPAKVYNTTTRQLEDPSAVAIKLIGPDGTKSTLPATRDGVGQYHAEIEVSSAGLYRYRIEASGALVAATEGSFIVEESIGAFD